MLSTREYKLLQSQQPLFHKWYLGDIIGEGSSGTVYKITDKHGNYFALKVIPVTIEDGTDVIPLNMKEQDLASKRKYLEEMTDAILAEVRVMKKLKHTAGIVTYQEYDVLKSDDLFLHIILIKMDLLQPLNKILRMRETEFSEKEIVTIGIQLLTSLSECQKHHIIHRDIKPSNIFVTEDNRYLLGDFGSARLLEKTMMASHKGTLAYMAPEVAAGQAFNSTVDIYSLGIMLYQLLNNGKLPFLKDSFKFSDIELAVEKRLSGTLLPSPANADSELGNIICKMCAFSPKERYASPQKCLDDFKNYMIHGKSRTQRNIKLSILCTLLCFMLLAAVVMLSLHHEEKKDLTTGISSGNVNSSGMIASDDKWLYYSQNAAEKKGIRVSKDGKEKEELCNHIMSDINITQKYIFFSSQYITITPGLYRMNKDGSNLVCLDNANISNPVVYGDYVYYLKEEADNKILCKISIEGGNIDNLSIFNSDTNYFYPYREHLYIYDHNAAQLISLDIYDGSKSVILDEAIQRFCVEDGFLYVSPASNDTDDSNKICIYEINVPQSTSKNPKNTPSKTITFPFKISEFNVCNGVIYAASQINDTLKNSSEKSGIWLVNRDGSGQKQIYTGSATGLQLIDQKLYFMDTLIVYYMDLNGHNIHTLDDMNLFYMQDS